MAFSDSPPFGPTPAPWSKDSDDGIARTAARRLEWSVQVPEDMVEVQVQNRWVTLTGVVDWRYQKLAAESLVHEIRGVRGITNVIKIRPRPYDADVREQVIDLSWTWQHGRA